MSQRIGHRIWAIPEGYIRGASHGPAPQMTSHEALCVLNASSREANLKVTIFYEDSEPTGPFKLSAQPRRTRHFRFDEFSDPERIPNDTPYATLIESDEPVVVQYTRLDSRRAENALFSTMAFPITD